MTITRRSFLGLIGASIAVAATPEAFQQLATIATAQPVPGPSTWRRVNSLWLHAHARGLYEIRRVTGETLQGIPLGKDGIYCWDAIGGFEIILRPNEPALCLAGPADPDWRMIWGDAEHTFDTKSAGWTLNWAERPW